MLPWSDGLARLSVYFPASKAPVGALDVLSGMLTLGAMSDLRHDLVFERPVALDLSGRDEEVRGARYFGIHLTCRPEQLDEAVVLLFAKIHQFTEDEPSSDEILRGKRQLAIYWELENRRPDSMSRRLAEFEAGPGYAEYDKYLSTIGSPSPQQIQKLASEVFQEDHAFVIERWPFGTETRTFTPETYKDFLNLALPQAIAKLGKKTEQASANLAGIKERPSPYEGNFDRTQLKPSDWNRYSILRGPHVFVKEFHLSPLVVIEALYSGGQIQEPPDHAGLTALMVQSAIQATPSKTHDELWFQLETAGAEIFPIVRDDLFGYGLITRPEVADAAIDALIDFLRKPQFSPENVNTAKAYLLEHWKAELASPEAFGSDLLKNAFFSHSAMYPDLKERISNLQKLAPNDVQAWWEREQKENPPTLVILGDTEGTELVPPFARSLSSSKWSPNAMPALSAIKTPKMPILIQDKYPGLPAPLLAFAFPGQNYGSPQADDVDLARSLFDGTFQSAAVSDFYYLRLFQGWVPQSTPDAPGTASAAVMQQLRSLIASDAALGAARKAWLTWRALHSLDSVSQGIRFFRRSLYTPDVDAEKKSEAALAQMPLAQLRDSLTSLFSSQNLLVCNLTPATQPH